MNTQSMRKQAHLEIELIFRILLPQNGLAVREEQVSLCHFMLDALLRNKIALCDAGVGIGKTYAYLVACIVLVKFYPQDRRTGAASVVISTSSVALQDAIIGEYIPFLSRILAENQIISKPIRAAIRKGKERFVCDERLTKRLEAIRGKAKNPGQLSALQSLKFHYDLDDVPGLSDFDRRQVCVPKSCPVNCWRKDLCRYHQYLREAKGVGISVQICNHNYLLADAAHREQQMKPLLTDYRALVIDEAHKLPDAAQQMYGSTLSSQDLSELCHLLEKERFPHMAQQLREKFCALMATMCRGELLEETQRTAFILTAGREAALRDTVCCLRRTVKYLAPRIPRWAVNRLERAEQTLNLFYTADRRYILYIQYDKNGSPCLCATSRELSGQLRQALWEQPVPVILTSGTLMAGNSFSRTKHIFGLNGIQRLEDFIAESPFHYEENCLLFIPEELPKVQMGSLLEIKYLAEQICQLIEATCGHTLVLFNSYSLMRAVCKQVKNQINYPLLEVWRHSQDVIRQFKQEANAVLFAAGSCWEGVDFPGDMVSSLIIVRLPFPAPDPVSEAEREKYPSLQEYIEAVVLPDMQKKLRQGFGRAIRTETDTCVVSILDYRAVPGQRYHRAVLDALPKCGMTNDIDEVGWFIHQHKGPDYFLQEEGQ